jgi:hypothetical protein
LINRAFQFESAVQHREPSVAEKAKSAGCSTVAPEHPAAVGGFVVVDVTGAAVVLVVVASAEELVDAATVVG